jgi:3',5'-cyclic-AMP phosphodiesterase
VDTRLLIQLSDVHLVPNGTLRPGVDPLENLDRALARLSSASSRPDAVVLTGDLADKGDAVSYRLLRERMDRLAVELATTIVFVPGNHDDRANFRRELLGQGDEGDHELTIDQVHWLGGLRLVTLDTVIPGVDDGCLRAEQLRWLSEELAIAAPEGTVVALHHPPITSPIRPMAAIALARPEGLEEVIAGSDVCLVLAGHNHHASGGLLGRVPVWVGPALAYSSDPLSEDTFVGLRGSAFTRVDLSAGRPLVTVVPVA